MSDHISTYLRIKPASSNSSRIYFDIDKYENFRLNVHLPNSYKSEFIDNTKLNHTFCYNGIIDQKSSQDHVFELVGIPSLKHVFEGYNSTVSISFIHSYRFIFLPK